MSDKLDTGAADAVKPRSRRFTFLAWAVVALAGLGAVAAITARVDAHPRWRHGAAEPQAVQEHLDFVVGWVLTQVDGSEEQKAEIQAIATAAFADLHGVLEDHRAHHGAFREVLTQPSIDRDRLEELRQEGMALAEFASRRLVTAIADIAEVLTPEQRTELLELLERHHR